MRNSIYQKPNAATTLTNSYNESMQYDKNGNILNLQRNGNYDDSVYNLQIDNLSYFYDTSLSNLNRLMKVTDLSNDPTGFKDDSNGSNDIADDYSYDANGNMVTDQNKGITSIKYNILNLPTEIIFLNNSTKKINYIYNAVGVKIRKIVTNGTVVSTTDYLNGFQYYKATSAAVAALKYIPTTEGYVSVTTSGTTNSYNYVFTYKDHLGNVRVSYGFGSTSSNPNGATYILQESNYYPFGLQHSNYNTDKLTYDDNIANGVAGSIVIPPLNYPLNKYKYNGKEYQDELGLNDYDFGARNYDPAIGRWLNIDPLAETSRRISPYVYCLNNPVYFIDPDGMDELDFEGDGWIEKEGGHGVYYDPNVHCQEDLKNQNEKYLFESGLYEREDGVSMQLYDSVDANGNGEWHYWADKDRDNDKASIEKENDSDKEKDINNEEDKAKEEINIDIQLEFEKNTSDIVGGVEKLDNVITILTQNPNLNIEILGNANFPKEKFNENSKTSVNGKKNGTIGELQIERAKAIQEILIQNGIDINRLSIGKGKIEIHQKSATIRTKK
ncbi:RHS repeat-associated core domain-containing protein [Flavobacterium sp. SUN046]|uniref:RHS repeat-associated core domain-containing protein n=1 Tax=Flavobacterium sp. SUN046 TaxID=3002440 RepID=UPI002DBC8E50|nr:RHS repeat-associated core domain-containing protein [Flavobacterium sp. SUN046]MEC4050176.1 RHS repeat-associated core domain-containing protein [Flavobacterium sp. SUN046]